MRNETDKIRYLQKAPPFKLPGFDGSIYAQHHYTGHTNLVVFFLRSASDPLDLELLREINAHLDLCARFQTVMLALLPEPPHRLKALHQELGLKFPLVSDTQGQTAARYGLVDGFLFFRKMRRAVIVQDKYSVMFHIAVAERDDDGPDWATIEDVLSKFPRR